jgi:hypothetical protein
LKKRALILGGNPEEKFPMPDGVRFDADGWAEADELGQIGQALIGECKCFESLEDARIVYLWKRKGSIRPKLLLGKCQRPSGLLRRFSSADFIVWLAANNCFGLTRWQMEALVFHELKHARLDADGEAISVPHDWEGFAEEIDRYGLWKRDIAIIAQAGEKALKLPFGEHIPKLSMPEDGPVTTVAEIAKALDGTTLTVGNVTGTIRAGGPAN